MKKVRFSLLLTMSLLFFFAGFARAETSQEQLDKALQYIQKNDFAKAAEQLNLITTIDPKFAPAYLHRGLLLSKQGQNKMALADFEKAISIDSKMAEAYVGKSMILFSEGNLDGSLAQLDKAIELNPGMGTAFYNRGMAHYYKGDFKESLYDFDMAKSLGEEVEQEIYEEVSMFRDIKESINKFTKAMDTEPSDPLNYYNRGILYYHSKDYKSALKDLEKAAELGMDLEEDLLEEVRSLASGKPLPAVPQQSIIDEAAKPLSGNQS